MYQISVGAEKNGDIYREVDDYIGVVYQCVRSDGVDSFYNYLGTAIVIGSNNLLLILFYLFLGRGTFRPTFLSKNDVFWLRLECERYHITLATSGTKLTNSFKLGKYNREYFSGIGWCKSVVTFEHNRMVQDFTDKKKIVTLVREFHDDQMIMTMTYEGIKATKYYQRRDGLISF